MSNLRESGVGQDTRDIPYTYKGEITAIPAVTGDFCPACGEAIPGALNRRVPVR